jgi:hypothetical protein
MSFICCFGIGGVLPGQLRVVRHQRLVGLGTVTGVTGFFSEKLGAIKRGHGGAGDECGSDQSHYKFHGYSLLNVKRGADWLCSPRFALSQIK